MLLWMSSRYIANIASKNIVNCGEFASKVLRRLIRMMSMDPLGNSWKYSSERESPE
jgi:hypothetical protein